MDIVEELKKVLKGEVDGRDETLEKYSRDASIFVVRPLVVVRPKDTEDVERLVKFVSLKKESGENVSITPRAGGTDMSGGPLGTSIILDTAHLDAFLQLENKTATVEPGMYFRDFDKETKKQNLELPSYPASREICTVGGMVANDSGGEKNLKYGKTARYVESLDVVLSDGEVHTLENLKDDSLQEKLQEESFEGNLYRKVSELLVKNKDVIEKGKPRVAKNSSGYALWDIGDGVSSLNLARLLTGSQGALGVFTKIKFKLVTPRPYSSMVVVFLKDIDDLREMVPEVLKSEPESFESYDNHTFKIAVKYFPELALQMKAGIISLGFSFLPEIGMLLTGGVPKLVLMVEFRSDSQQDAYKKAKDLSVNLELLKSSAKIRLIKNEHGTRKYWAIRRESFNLLRNKVRGLRTAPFIEDFVVPPLSIPDFLPKLNSILSEFNLTYTIAGHIGDGNFHIIPLIDPKRKDASQVIHDLSEKVYALVFSYHGSISGEHNDGLVRTPYVEAMFGSQMTRLFEEIESIFDPLGIFNPGKKVGTTLLESERKFDFPGSS
ncbi:FAD-binding oxidoreductase [Patescibacteria group bacterium]|nr:MAG: FAD-binding oxidoreductase [Patescibacteria group bacterium]